MSTSSTQSGSDCDISNHALHTENHQNTNPAKGGQDSLRGSSGFNHKNKNNVTYLDDFGSLSQNARRNENSAEEVDHSSSDFDTKTPDGLITPRLGVPGKTDRSDRSLAIGTSPTEAQGRMDDHSDEEIENAEGNDKDDRGGAGPNGHGRLRSWKQKMHDRFLKDDAGYQHHLKGIGAEGSEYKVQHRYMPILSGLICPFSVLLDIPGLTERWYVRTYGFDVIETQPNPVILDVGQAISMAFGVAANVALISRFLERKPYLSTWIAIIGLTIHDVINICVVVVFGVVHRFSDGFTYGTAYWMTVAATVASLTCNITLVIDLVRTRNFKASGSGLTEKQRSLVIAVMSLLCYIGLGSLVFSFLESFSYIDSLYFTIVTITSVGFGDLAPTTTASKIFSMFYDVVGLVLLAFTIAIARETVIETFEANYRARREVLAKRARERKEEKRKRAKEKRDRLERHLQNKIDDLATKAAGDSSPIDAGAPLASMLTTRTIGGGRGGSRSGDFQSIRKHNTRVESKEDQAAKRALDFCDERDQGFSIWKASVRWAKRKFGVMEAYLPDMGDREKDRPSGDDTEGTETATAVGSDIREGVKLERSMTSTSTTSFGQEEKFKTFKQQLRHEQQKEFRLKITIAISLFAIFWTVGAAVFHVTEGWTYFISLWFCFVFFTTIGYGDYTPKSPSGRAFFVGWALFGIANMTLTLSVLTEAWSSRYKSSIHEGRTRRTLGRMTRSVRARDTSALRLLALEGFNQEEDIEAKDLPTKLTDAIRGFHDHARYFMLGRSGEVPEDLRKLFEAASEFDDELETMLQDGQIEGGAEGGTRHFLFMVSYERQFDVLIDTAERLSQVFKSHEDELATMRDLNNQLRIALRKNVTEGPGSDNDDDQSSNGDETRSKEEGLLPFERRPPGGFDDDEVEQELVAEIDEDDADEVDDVSEVEYDRSKDEENDHSSPSQPQIRSSKINAASPSSASEAEKTLSRSSTMLDRLATEEKERATIKLRLPSELDASSKGTGQTRASSPQNAEETVSTPTTPIPTSPFGRSRTTSIGSSTPFTPSPGLGMNRTQTLTFVEPDRPNTPSRGGGNRQRRRSNASSEK